MNPFSQDGPQGFPILVLRFLKGKGPYEVEYPDHAFPIRQVGVIEQAGDALGMAGAETNHVLARRQNHVEFFHLRHTLSGTRIVISPSRAICRCSRLLATPGNRIEHSESRFGVTLDKQIEHFEPLRQVRCCLR